MHDGHAGPGSGSPGGIASNSDWSSNRPASKRAALPKRLKAATQVSTAIERLLSLPGPGDPRGPGITGNGGDARDAGQSDTQSGPQTTGVLALRALLDDLHASAVTWGDMVRTGGGPRAPHAGPDYSNEFMDASVASVGPYVPAAGASAGGSGGPQRLTAEAMAEEDALGARPMRLVDQMAWAIGVAGPSDDDDDNDDDDDGGAASGAGDGGDASAGIVGPSFNGVSYATELGAAVAAMEASVATVGSVSPPAVEAPTGVPATTEAPAAEALAATAVAATAPPAPAAAAEVYDVDDSKGGADGDGKVEYVRVARAGGKAAWAPGVSDS